MAAVTDEDCEHDDDNNNIELIDFEKTGADEITKRYICHGCNTEFSKIVMVKD